MFINQNKNQYHNYFMKLALLQASKVIGNTKENPAVGCVIVKNNNIVSVGSTNLNGRPHAESNAIKLTKKNLEKSSLYVTLEPCSHYGLTPPCSSLIIKRKIKRVYFSIYDPDPRSFNKCSIKFRKKKILVKNGILKKDINSFYRSYIKNKKSYLPFVTAKLAISRDFFYINKKKKWITNEFSRGRVHMMRSQHDCIITSSRTVNIDNPTLNCRIRGLIKRSPSIIIFDKNLKINLSSKIIKNANKYKTHIFYNKYNKNRLNLLSKYKIRTFKVPLDNSGQLDLKKALIKVKKLGFSRIFLESGIKLMSSFFEEDLIDDLKVFISKSNLKKNGKGNTKIFFKKYLKNKKNYLERVNLFGEKLVSYKIR
tara:strand:+ start:2279 stop:3382 length:1104 start_codon:yes stop_codon:yes gene_type:complete